MTTYGYARVSTAEQNEARQVIALARAGVSRERIFIDRQSGRDFNRPRYRALLDALKEGDALFVLSIDRLGRNYVDIQEQWRELTGVRGVDIVVLDMPLLDTRTGRDLMGTFIADLVLQILSFVAESEREAIRRRQAEGIAAAKARGVRFGRPPREVPACFDELRQRWREGGISLRAAAEACGMPPSTFYSKAVRREAEVRAAERGDDDGGTGR